jgi:hypothetical protein
MPVLPLFDPGVHALRNENTLCRNTLLNTFSFF